MSRDPVWLATYVDPDGYPEVALFERESAADVFFVEAARQVNPEVLQTYDAAVAALEMAGFSHLRKELTPISINE